MTALVIATVDVHDPVGIQEYIRRAGALLAPFNARVVGFDDHPQVLEGTWPGERTMVLEFESEAAARKWYDSQEYQAAAEFRRRSSTTAMVLLTTPAQGDW